MEWETIDELNFYVLGGSYGIKRVEINHIYENSFGRFSANYSYWEANSSVQGNSNGTSKENNVHPISKADNKKYSYRLEIIPEIGKKPEYHNIQYLEDKTHIGYIYVPSSKNSFTMYVKLQRKLNNSSPVISKLETKSAKLYEGSTVNIKGTASDIDSGDVVTVKYKVNNSSIRNIKAYVSQGTEEAFSKVLIYKNGSLYDGSTLVIANLIDGNHTITVWAEDNNGGKSEEHKITIITKRNRPPELTITDYPQDLQGLITTDKLTITGTVSDPDDGAILTVTAQINNDEPQTIPIEDSEWSFSFAVKQLNEGDNTLTFEVADQYGATDKKQVKLTNTVHASPAPISIARYKLDTPEPITDLIMWIKHKADADIKAYASIVQKGEPDNYVEMTKVEGTSPTGVLESEFTYSADVAGMNAKVKIVNADQAMMIMGGMSNNAES